MKKNIDGFGRLLRLVFALFLFGLSWYSFKTNPIHMYGWVLLIAGAFCLYQALASWCVLYAIMGKNSCPIDKR